MRARFQGELSRRQFLAGTVVAILAANLLGGGEPRVIGIGATGRRVVRRIVRPAGPPARVGSVLLVGALGDAYGNSDLLNSARAYLRSGNTVHVIAEFPALFEAHARCRAATRCIGELKAAGVSLHITHLERVMAHLPRSASLRDLRMAVDASLESDIARLLAA